MSKFKLTRNEEQEGAQPQTPPPVPDLHTTTASPAPPASRVEAKPDFGQLGTHVGSVLNAAEEAAARIEREARMEAQRLREHAQVEAAELLEVARRDSDAASSEAERIRAEAEEFAASTRVQAESAGAEIIAKAERKAVTMRQDAQRRQQALQLDISHAENRLRDLVSALHGLADRLEGVLATPSAAAPGESESLADALVFRAEEAKN